MAFTSAAGSTGSAKTTVAREEARLTLAFSTPGTARKAFSTRPTHEAQCMPSISIWTLVGAVNDGAMDRGPVPLDAGGSLRVPIMGRSNEKRCVALPAEGEK